VVTFVYDLVYILFLKDNEATDAEFSDMMSGVRRFAYFFFWISFLLRPVVIIVLWKDSLDFNKITTRAKQDSVGSAMIGNSMP